MTHFPEPPIYITDEWIANQESRSEMAEFVDANTFRMALAEIRRLRAQPTLHSLKSPSWIKPGAKLDLDFTSSNYFKGDASSGNDEAAQALKSSPVFSSESSDTADQFRDLTEMVSSEISVAQHDLVSGKRMGFKVPLAGPVPVLSAPVLLEKCARAICDAEHPTDGLRAESWQAWHSIYEIMAKSVLDAAGVKYGD